MSRSDSLEALRRANPRAKAGFAESLDVAVAAVRARIDATAVAPSPRRGRRRRLVAFSVAAASLVATATSALFLTIGSHGGGPGVQDATAAVERAATLTAASAARSGTAVVRITHNGELWAGCTIRWHGRDVAVTQDGPRRRGKAGGELRVVAGMMYGVDPVDGRWHLLGSPDSIDPGSGTTPDDYLAAVRRDVGGGTLRRITDGLTGLTTSRLDDGSTLYSGSVASGLIARETGFKEGHAIRVLPFGYVAHDEAADGAAPLDVAVTVAGGIVSDITVSWGTPASEWRYTVAYSGLGATAAPVAPTNARPLRRG